MRFVLQMARPSDCKLVMCAYAHRTADACDRLVDVVMRRRDPQGGDLLIGVCSDHMHVAAGQGFELYGVKAAKP